MVQQPVSRFVYLRLVLTMVFWGGTFVAGKVVAEELHPVTAAASRFLAASLILLTVTYLREQHLPRLNQRQWTAMLLLGLTGIFSYNILFFLGLQTVEAGRGAMIIAANPVVTTLLAVALFGERFNLSRSFGIFLSVIGALLVISQGDISLLLQGRIGTGELCMVGCVLSWSAYALVGKRMLAEVSPLTAVTCSCLTGTIMLLITALSIPEARDLSRVTWTGAGNIAYLAVLGTSLGFIWFYEGVQKLGAGRASLFVNLVPVSGVLCGILLLGERPEASLFIGGGLVLGGLLLINRPMRARALTQAPAKSSAK